VPIGQVLVGWDAGLPPAVAARAGGSLIAASTRIADGAHAELIRSWRADPVGTLDPEALWASAYGRSASRVIELTGSYFGATDAASLVPVARGFLENTGGRPGESAPDAPIRVRAVKGSECVQIVDGHHRAALAAVDGAPSLDVRVEQPSVRTPLQAHLLNMSWMAGEPELYHPVDLPDVAEWPLVRQCTDRLAMMRRHLDSIGLVEGSYVDVAACYGWFVSQFAEAGFDAKGFELDPLAVRVATDVYGLPADAIVTGEAVALLTGSKQTFDVVSCFSLAHHFVLGRAADSAETLIKALDSVTGKVLFFDMGQGTERWFRSTMPEWTPEHIQRWLEEQTSFTKVTALGTDDDARPPFEDNYRRTLFACER
jgi:hypothetical protein